MSKRKNYKTENRLKSLLFCTVSLCLVVLTAFSGLWGCSSCTGDGATADESVPSTTVNKETYVFAPGIKVDGVSLDGLTYNRALELVVDSSISGIKDFTLTVTARGESFDYGKGDFSFNSNAEEILTQAIEYSEQLYAKGDTAGTDTKTYSLTLSAEESSVSAIVAAIADKVDVSAKNASITASGEKVKITKDKSGYKLDTDDLTKRMLSSLSALASGDKLTDKIEAKVDEIKPDITYNDLDGNITLLSSFSTYSKNTADGDHNMATALEACNGSVINPGEVWSFNACTGDSNLASNGYRPAAVIIGGKIEQGIGGGICQASTTIYNAALLADMEIVERSCHYFQSAYADAGLDATIDYPYLDLRLRNTTKYPIYFECYMTGATLYCNIYGWKDPSFDNIKVESYTYDANRAANYYRAAATRIYYKNGVEIKREELPGSTYHYTSPVEPTKPKATKPAATKPAPKPVVTKPVTQAPTEPPITTETPTPAPTPTVTDPVEIPSTEVINY